MMRWLLLLLIVPSLAQAQTMENLIIFNYDDVSMGITEMGDATAYDNYADNVSQTDTLVALAASGVTLANFMTPANCVPSRTTFMTGARSGRRVNPLGDVFRDSEPTTVDLDPYGPTLIQKLARDAGMRTAYFGKLHLGQNWDAAGNAENYLTAMGFDHAEAVSMRGIIDPRELADTANVNFDNPNSCLGHNYWVSINKAGTVALEEVYANKVIYDAALAFIRDTVLPDTTNKWLVLVNSVGPHGPQHCGTDGAGLDSCSQVATDCDYGSGATKRDDRPPGGIATSFHGVYDEQLVDVELRTQAILDLAGLSLHATTGNTVAIITADNGTQSRAASTTCAIDSDNKGKGSLFPCGLRVPFVADGVGITATGATIVGLHSLEDLHETVLELLGISTSGTSDGRSFASCLTSATPNDCWAQDPFTIQKWQPLGGNTDGSIASQPMPATFPGEYDRHEIASYSHQNNGYWLLVRYNAVASAAVGGAVLFCEEFYSLTAGAELYGDTPRAENCTTSLTDGLLVPADFAGQTADEAAMLPVLQARHDSIAINGGEFIPTLAGASQ